MKKIALVNHLLQNQDKIMRKFKIVFLNIKDFPYYVANIQPLQTLTGPILFYQNKKSQALCFNLDYSLLATTENETIHIWQFQEGKMNAFIQPKIQHKNDVACILIGQKYRHSFFSAGGIGDHRIFMVFFKQQLGNFEAENYQNRKNGGFNKNEDQLFKSDLLGNIRIWKVNQMNKVFSFEKELQGNNKQCQSINLNQSETQLISFGEEKQIIIWQKQQNNDCWKVQDKITEYDQACKCKFLNDQIFVFCTHNEGKNKVVEISKMQLDFKKSDYFSLPIQYINNKQININCQAKQIYICLKKIQIDQLFKIQKQVNICNFIQRQIIFYCLE
ncbi:unnamed protein product [Paramecium sonneborni]|uniref:WD40-repeat-containing domain n=1 Tax=Paramecium sonneborni TaxID=65129 RepID=A0A8S1LJZ6_9CILI|nr:unnamed protein product [Paramecium sonneborni]